MATFARIYNNRYNSFGPNQVRNLLTIIKDELTEEEVDRVCYEFTHCDHETVYDCIFDVHKGEVPIDLHKEMAKDADGILYQP